MQLDVKHVGCRYSVIGNNDVEIGCITSVRGVLTEEYVITIV